MYKSAQWTISDIFSDVASYVGSKFNKDKPVESFLSFMGPGILYMLGGKFKILAVVLALAEAFGFNIGSLFESLKEKLKPILEDLHLGEQVDASEIKAAVQQSAEESAVGSFDPDKFKEAVNKVNASSLDELLFIKKVALKYKSDLDLAQKFKLFMQELPVSTLGRGMRTGIVGFIIKVVSWVVTAALVSLGFAVVGGLAAKIVGLKKDKMEEAPTSQEDTENKHTPATKQVSVKEPRITLEVNQSAPAELFKLNFNDKNNVWLMHLNIRDIDHQLINWAQQLYPQLHDTVAFQKSPVFNQVAQMFENRNKGAEQLGIIAVPAPFQSIKQIVDKFVMDVASRTNKPTNPVLI